MKYIEIRLIPDTQDDGELSEFCEAAARHLLALGAEAVAPVIKDGEPELATFIEGV